MASPLEQLPEELQLHIVSHVFQRGHLLALSSASKTMLNAAASALYRRFYSGETCKPVRGFLRTLCSNAALPKHVRDVKLSLHHEKTFTAPTALDYGLFAAALKKGLEPGPTLDRALSALKSGCHTVEMLAICCLATNIADLALDLSERAYRSTESGRSIKRRHTSTCEECPEFPESILSIIRRCHHKIEEVTLHGANSEALHDQRSQVVLFEFLALRSLRALRCVSMKLNPNEQVPLAAPRCSSVRDLSLLAFAATAIVVGNILTTCTTLESFHLSVAPAVLLFTDAEIAVWKPALHRHRSSLKKLMFYNTTRDATIGCLSGFHNLQELDINETLLCGKAGWSHVNLEKVLPSSISKLQIESRANLEEISGILMSFNRWKPANFVSLEITFVVEQDGLNYQYIQSWGAFDDGFYRYEEHNECGFLGTLFVMNGFGHDTLEIVFKCTEPEVALNFAKLGARLDHGGLDYFLEAAMDNEEVQLWKGGPRRYARSLFIDEAMYEGFDSDDD